jgi:NADPH:quinone reductase-like Zn-dependent oxidoreductase
VLVYGALSSANAAIGIANLLFCGVKVHGFWLNTYLSQLSASELAEFMGHIMSILSKRVIEPLVGEKFSLDQVKEAIKKSLVKNSLISLAHEMPCW